MIGVRREIWRLLAFTVIVWGLYAYLTFTSPLGRNLFALSMGQMFLIRLTIVLPYLFLWLSGVFGASRLASYSEIIYEGSDGQALALIARGLFVLLSSSMLATLIGVVSGRWPEVHVLLAPITIFNGYVYAILPLVGYLMIWQGARKLGDTMITVKASVLHWLPVIVVTGLFAAVYVVGVFTNPDRQVVVSQNVENPSFYVNDWVIALTIVGPTIIGWFFGLMATSLLSSYRRGVAAVLYKKGLNFLVWGLNFVVIGSVMLSLLISLGSSRLMGVGLGPLLGLIYVWLLFLMMGYGLVAWGTQMLYKIERV